MANMMLCKEKDTGETLGLDVFINTVSVWIKGSRWRKKCKSLIIRARTQLLIHKNRREAIERQSRADIAQLLMYDQHDEVLARVDQLHNDRCILSAYDQIETYFYTVHANLREIGSRSKLSYKVVEAVSSLVFAASRCGELPELRLISTLFRKHFGYEFERVNVELQPGNFVNSGIIYNLGNNSVSDDVKLQMTSQIAREFTLCLQPDKISERKHQRQASRFKDTVLRSGSKISTSGSRNSMSKQCDSNYISSESSPPIQGTSAVCLDDTKGKSYTTEDVNGRNLAKGLDSQERNVTVSSKSNNVKKNSAHRRGASIKPNAACGKNDGSRYKDQMSDDQNILIKEGLSRCKTYNGRRLEGNEDSKPRLSYVHPKLPDYDELVATFTEYKEEYRKSISSDTTLPNWMRDSLFL